MEYLQLTTFIISGFRRLSAQLEVRSGSTQRETVVEVLETVIRNSEHPFQYLHAHPNLTPRRWIKLGDLSL